MRPRFMEYARRDVPAILAEEIAYADRVAAVFESTHDGPLSEADVLEIGHGPLAVQAHVMAAKAKRLVAIDTDFFTGRLSRGTMREFGRHHGLRETGKRLVRHVLFDRRMFRAVQKLATTAPALVRMDAGALGFADRTFDFIYSRAVFEHIRDVRAAIREMARVLRPGGLAHVGIHLFPSLSGGHRDEWLRPTGERVPDIPPWDHLREWRCPAPRTYLNQWKCDRYEHCFAESFRILGAEREYDQNTERFLSPELATELAAKGFTRDDLSTTSVRFLLECRGRPLGLGG